MSSPQGQPPAAAPSRSGGKKWLILATAVLLLGGGVVAFQRREKASGHGEEQASPEPGVVELEPFVLNLADPAGDRYVRLALRLVLDRRAVAERAASRLGQAKLRDRILTVLSRKRVADMTSSGGRERLQAEIRAASEALLAEPPFHDAAGDPAPARVVDVFFTEFLVQ